MKILIVEDVYSDAEQLRSTLLEEFPGSDITEISTESSFRNSFPTLAESPPDVVVLDVLLRWADPDPEMKPRPEDVVRGGFERAGLRCRELLASHPRTASIPVVFCSNLDRDDIRAGGYELPPNTWFSSKRDDLAPKIRSILAARMELSTDEPAKRDRVFISYSHKDRRFLDELLVHLRPLERAGRVAAWSDKQIEAGTKWFDQITRAVASTSVAVMLVTADFLASDFIHEHELGPFLKAAKNGGARILWIPIRACSYKESALKDYQAVVSPDKPLAEMKAERDQAWVRICEEIRQAAG